VSDLAAAYARCERIAREHYENFPVASLLMPPSIRPHVAAVYAFARAADDFADEGSHSADRRIELLEGWSARLRAVAAARAPQAPGRDEPPAAIEIFQALGNTIAEKSLPVSLFEDLLSAFRQDVIVCRYATWTDVLDYCRRSANPVGRLVLRIAGYRDDRMDVWSDAICTALQLTNFWQDLSIDTRRGRFYLPADMGLADAVDRTRRLFEAGRPLCDAVSGRLRYELRAVWLGGTRILDRLRAADYDPWARRPTLTARDAPSLAWRFCTWRPSSPMQRRTPAAR